MPTTRLDAIARAFANRRLTRQATPIPDAGDGHQRQDMLFVQSFQSGSISPAAETTGRYTVTLDHGLGQTIYFSDRPERIVGASPTGAFLEGLGFSPDNPPNAALVTESPSGETGLAVVELFDPVYDPAGPTVTYEVAALATWEDSTDLGFTVAPTGLADLEPTFGTAHLFIDGCPQHDITCYQLELGRDLGSIPSDDFGGFCYHRDTNACLPCHPDLSQTYDALIYWGEVCETTFPDCKGMCRPHGIFEVDPRTETA